VRFTTAVLLCSLLTPSLALAQSGSHGLTLPATSPFLGGVPTGTVAAEPLTLGVVEVIRRALEHNLGVLLAEDTVERARGTRREALSALLPNVGARTSAARQKTNLEAFGFPLGPDFPRVVGPFNVFDARVFLSQTVFDWHALNEAKAEAHALAAERHSYRGARDLVVLVAANLYLQALATAARAQSARAQFATAETLYNQAVDLRQNGIVAGIDVVRAEVRMSTERQRVTAAENEAQKTKLQLARVIGLPIGQEFTVVNTLPEVPVPEMTLDDALARAYRDRPDYLAAQERVQAAEATRQAARGEALPSLHVTADYGAIGLTWPTALPTFRVAGELNVPIFQGGRVQGAVVVADAELRQRRAEVEDLRAEIYYDVRTAFLDLKATEEELQTATRNRALADQQLTQSRDRFAAGVANNVEVVQAQEAVALANELFIAAAYGYNVSKAMLAGSLGTAEDAVAKYLGGAN
jgi:outer membrane protein TolC